ncbi:acyl-CoA dehydrogenase family protein [Brevibacterium sp. UMB1308A]|uniref:acyl-CoA dehydrogenase family protein n=1 Tax=Brevibacterium sp. UMB1308A TaxID=3050608 RepID=UPI00254E57CC|nr:acyl-CoA dehydrogenase family protein [Brevibacterium sp. UMB1308A]MDK8347684.1 acyl-CoA dehydrogenase family protein [Brevibacterium sp. UMB1308B]MDK8714561.1 acyl-CoA dehydrogenase family protein [Brevibacterium sp. UMB1308A]
MILDGYRGAWENKETDDLRSLTRNFLEKEAKPNLARWAEEHKIDREFWNKAGELGLLCVSIPEEYGGGGGTFAHEAVVLQEQGYIGDAAWGYAVHSTIVAHYINAIGTEEQKKRWLPGLASGELVGAIAMTEPGTGSDLQAVKTKAVLDGDEYVINGAKTFISNGTHADIVIIVARTNDQPGGKGLSLIVAEVNDLPGFSRGRVLDKVGQRGQDTRELFFEDMRVPVENLLGGVEGKGFIHLMQQLPQERLALAVTGVTTAEYAVRLTIDYAKEREAFGRPILGFQNTKFVLAECATDTFAARTFVDHLVSQHIEGKLTTEQASAGKYWATDIQNTVIDRCVQVFGGYGYMLEYPIARMYADARVQKIYGGTNEIMKDLISRGL